MNKRAFTVIMVLMGLSIIGIIVVQVVWIDNAIRVKNELFDRSVNEALTLAARKLEDRQNFEFISRFPGPDSLIWEGKNIAPPPPPRPVKIIRDRQNPANTRFEVKTDTSKQVHVFTFNLENGKKMQTERIIISEKDTLLTDTRAFMDASLSRLDSMQLLTDSLDLLKPEIRQRVHLKTEKLRQFTNQVMAEITTFNHTDVPIEEMHVLVKTILADRNIPIAFDLAIAENDTLRETTAQADSLALAASPYKTRLFPHAIFARNSYLVIHFPGQSRFIYRSVSWLLLASLVFSLIILLTFTLSVWFMLKQKKISEMKSDFINNMTHEFKTPIATISVAADSILNEKVIGQPEKVGFYVDMIKKENTRMNRQVEDILTIARLDKKDFGFNWVPVHVHELIEDVIQSIVLQVEKRGGEISTALSATNPIITTDKNHCANMIYNLLDNANKYSPDKPHIRVETQSTSRGVIISVIDQGTGMSKSVQAKIFERFYRQTTGNIHNVKGFGLGLSYVRAVVEANQGSISVHSEPGKGSRFDVFLPFHRENRD